MPASWRTYYAPACCDRSITGNTDCERCGSWGAVIRPSAMADYPKLWTLIKVDLSMSGNLLPNPPGDPSSLGQYYEFVEHNELELACDALEEAAKDRSVGKEFWLALRDAAKKMQLDDHVSRYERLAEQP